MVVSTARPLKLVPSRLTDFGISATILLNSAIYYIGETERECMIKRGITLLFFLTAPVQADTQTLTTQQGLEQLAEHYVDMVIPNRFKDIPMPDIKGDVSLKKFKHFKYTPDNSNLTWDTNIQSLDQLGITHQGENHNSYYSLDQDGDVEFQWRFKKTF